MESVTKSSAPQMQKMGRGAMSLLLLLLVASGAAGQLCENHIDQYKTGLKSGETWALQMYDSSTKLPDGALTGLVSPPGNFDECLGVRAPEFIGKYCRIKVNFAQGPILPPLPTFEVAACGPSTCSDEEIAQVAEFNLGTVNLSVSSAATYTHSCEYEGLRSLDTGFWVAIGVISCLTLLVVVCGLCDWLLEKREKKPPKVVETLVSAFSLQRNLKQVFRISRKKVPGQISSIHGIRVLSTAWVVLGHRYEIFAMAMPFMNSFQIYTLPQEFSSMPIINALFSVDTFFVLSGFLVTYICCTDAVKGRKFNIIQYYVYRYLRLTAPVAFMILFIAFIMYHLGNGPQWNVLFWSQSQTCKDRWWTTLLYINNVVDYPSMSTCLPQSWYLSVDMQLSWAAPIVLIPLLRWPKYAVPAMGMLILLSTALNFGLTYAYDFFWTYPIYNIPNPTSQTDYWFWCYLMPWMRAQPYLVGMLLGWYMSTPRKPMGRLWATAVWLLSTAATLAVLFTISLAYRPDHPYNETEAAFYNSLHRLVWGLSVAWVIYACSNGLGGPVDAILSWRYWQPLSKLSYCVFLTHMFLIFYEVGVQRTPSYFTQPFMVHGLLADLLAVIPLSLLLYLLTEAPAMALTRKLFGKDKKQAAVGGDMTKQGGA
ncbi:O-acyltransferase like protein-like [Neocloeon triangulifer]|uniref:O-acyltransferase like protein-like n=1 Tax=Neocloeon triangulifer TaxID=2078957 RepID=UPI00286F2E74|nr:O-acyltransferase like protein-like [Neocloeon triangulifer]